MMRSRRSRWIRSIGAVVLTGGMLVASTGLGVTPAGAAPPVKDDPHASLPQNWDRIIPAATRFVVLTDFANAAVRDNETGLVWEQSPLTTLHPWDFSAGFTASALFQCTSRTTGGRKGWRLPAIAELMSLIDPTNPGGNPDLPVGHPFTNIQLDAYWLATTVADIPSTAWAVPFNGGFVGHAGKSLTNRVWCVRGGMNADAY